MTTLELCLSRIMINPFRYPSHFLLDTATWKVKEYKIVSEPSLLTGWLASWLAGCVVNLVSNFLTS